MSKRQRTFMDDLADSIESAGYWGPALLVVYLVIYFAVGFLLVIGGYMILLEIQG